MKKVSNNTLQLVLLVLIGTSVTFSTLHSHHPWKWNQTDQHVNTGHKITKDSTLCPVNGYLFSANIVDNPPMTTSEIISEIVVTYAETQQHYSFTGNITGRSPPFIS